MATYELVLPSYRELRASLLPAHVAELPIRRVRVAARRSAPSIAHLRPGAGTADRALSVGAYALTAAVLCGLAGSMVMGVALAYEMIAMPWSRAFATGMVGGASAGVLVGAMLGLLLGRQTTSARR